MFSTNLPDTVEQAREFLENHSLMMAQKSSETRHRGMSAPSQPGRLPDEIYNSINEFLDRRLNKLYFQSKTNK